MRSQLASAAVKYLVGASIPRSGHHFLQSILKDYYEDEIFYCEHYTVKDCCKFTPCTRGGKHRIVYQKSHDFDFELPQHISDVLYIVQFREPVAQVLSDFELELRHGVRLNLPDRATKEHFIWFLAVKGAYYRRFYDKWLRDRRANAVYIDYDDLAIDPGSAARTIAERVDGAINSQKLLAITAALRSLAFNPRVVEASPYFDAQLLGAYEDYVLRHCVGLPFRRRFEGDYREHELWGLLLFTDHDQPPPGRVDRLTAAARRAPQHPEVRWRLARRELRGGNEAAAVEILGDLLDSDNPFFHRIRQSLAVASKQDGWLLPEPLRDAGSGAFPTEDTAASEAASEASADRQAATAARQGPLAANASGGKYPIAILSFNRPHYLEPVLRSLAAQTLAIDPSQVFLFQDGYRAKDGGDLTNPRSIEQCIQVFNTVFPRSEVRASTENLGIALNFERAERFMFENMEADAAFFFEDDLILSPHYCGVLEKLTQLALTEKRIAYVAAYGDHRASLAMQRLAPQKLMPMVHKWGFALTRRQWLAQRDLIDPYLDIIRRADYQHRDHSAIRDYYRQLGFGSPGTSQDGMKDVASCVLGTTKIMSSACFGKYIGEIGAHSNKKVYDELGFARTELFPDAVTSFEAPSGAQLDRWIASGRNAAKAAIERPAAVGAERTGLPGGLSSDADFADAFVRAMYRVFLFRDADQKGAASAVQQLRSGRTIEQVLTWCLRSEEFAQKHVQFLTTYVGPRSASTSAPTRSIAVAPAPMPVEGKAAPAQLDEGAPAQSDEMLGLRMSPAEKAAFIGLLKKASLYLEWGSGGTTLAAARSKVSRIVSVETDPAWIERLKHNDDIAAAMANGRLRFHHIDVGPVGEWGVPSNDTRIRNWPRYALEPFTATDLDFDLVLVDGRFRMHCLLAAACCCGSGATIFLHDYRLRHLYSLADKYFDLIDQVDTAVILRMRPRINHRALYIDLIQSLFVV